ncbi:substrate-binding periplasmic protein [Dongshaea marina]|uniref:substrate-binding periplasmic protein n=1 Tax=Dongshaea marina TaxID=2047966 RepID=UPI001F2129FE|nr:transporter substrate-binding domain-containing protein [Dongshaea marina]
MMGRLYRLLWIGLLIVLGNLLPGLASAETITISTGEFPPLNSERFKLKGLVPAIVSESFRYEGVEVDYKFMPWTQAYNQSRDGMVSGTAHWYESKARREDHLYSDPLMSETIVWFHMKGHPLNWNSFSDLKGVRIAAINGYTYSADFYKAIEEGEIDVLFVDRLKQSFDLMLAGKIDATLESIDVGYYSLRQWYPQYTVDLFTNHPKAAMVQMSYLLLSKKGANAQSLLDKFNRGLKKLKARGRLNQLIFMSRSGQLEPEQSKK